MERDHEQRSDLIELGAASTETKGFEGKVPDLAIGLSGTNLSDD